MLENSIKMGIVTSAIPPETLGTVAGSNPGATIQKSPAIKHSLRFLPTEWTRHRCGDALGESTIMVGRRVGTPDPTSLAERWCTLARARAVRLAL